MPAEKAGVRGFWTTKNLVYASVLYLTTIVADGTIEKTELYKLTTKWLASQADEVVEIIADSPADIRTTIESMLKEIENNPPDNNDPPDSQTALKERERRRKLPPA